MLILAKQSQYTSSLPWVGFLIAALDSLATGVWAITRPHDLFALLNLPVPQDAFLWSVLGFLILTRVLFLVLAARRQQDAGFALVALIGQALQCGLWLWLLGTDRVQAASLPLMLLCGHDAVMLMLIAVCLLLTRRSS